MAKIESYFNCDLKKAVQVQVLSGNVFSMDNNGNRICVRIFNDGEKATVTGSVSGRCILADGSTVNVSGGLTTANGQSVAYVDIPQGCLLIPGTLKITVQLTDSGVITTLAAILTTVYQTKTDNVITPSQQIINDWNAAISSALGAQDAQISALSTALTAETNARQAADTAEATARQNADNDLKSALNGTVYQITWTDDAMLRQNGTVSTSAQEGATGRCVSDYILCKDATKAMVCCESNNPYIGPVCFYDENKLFISYLKQIGTNYVPVEINIPSGAYYARISSQIAYKSVSFLYCEEPVVLLLAESNTKAINGKQDKTVYTPQEYDYTNYLLLVEQYEGYEWAGLSGTPYLNAKTNYVATSMVELDKTKPLASSNSYTGYALFYDENGDYLSYKQIY